MYRYFKQVTEVGNGNYVYYWNCVYLLLLLFDERINSIKITNHNIAPNLDYYVTKTRVKFIGSRLKQDSATFNHKKVVNICILYEISKSFKISDYPKLENCSFRAVTLTKNADINKFKYSGYGIGFDRHGSFSFPDTGSGRNVIIFE